MANVSREQLTQAGNEWLKLQFITGAEHFKKIFSEVSTLDYLTLLLLRKDHGIHESKAYLKDIAESQDMPMNKVSKRVQKLQDAGYVDWKHDEGGTYITISKRGEDAMKLQEEKVADFMSKTIEVYGYEEFIAMIEMRKKLHVVMDNILEQEQ